jgi:hypothetical protein
MRHALDFDVDDVLELVGLARRRSAIGMIAPMIGVLAAGIAVGAGLGLLLAPTSGRQLRHEAGGKMNDIRERLRGEDDVHPTP